MYLEYDLRDESIIDNPLLLNSWCKANSTRKTKHEMSIKAINHFKGKIPVNKMYEIIEPIYKDSTQSKNAKKRIAVKSLELEIFEISKTLPISKKRKLLNYITQSLIETGRDMEENNKEVDEYIG